MVGTILGRLVKNDQKTSAVIHGHSLRHFIKTLAYLQTSYSPSNPKGKGNPHLGLV